MRTVVQFGFLIVKQVSHDLRSVFLLLLLLSFSELKSKEKRDCDTSEFIRLTH